jgi:predicted DNA-binding helix-hairpin-helix protein
LQKFRTRIRTSSARKPFRLALNTATERELTQHPAIGPKRAARILKLRNKQPLTPELLQQKKIWALEEWPGVAGYWVWEP